MPNTIPTLAQDLKTMNLAQVAEVIADDWTNVYFGAEPYLSAMRVLDVPADVNLRTAHFYADTAGGIVRYFLSNASSWRGETARAVKAELRRRLER